MDVTGIESVEMPRSLALRLLAAAQAEPGREVCGLVAARDGRPCRYLPIPNVAPAPERSFEMDPRALADAQRALRARGETLWAVFHSHPSAPAQPSPADLARIGEPDALLLIASLASRGVLQLRAWRRDGDAVRELPLRVFG